MGKQRLVIAVAGGSGSGKSSVVRGAIARLGVEACLLDQDSYFLSNGDGAGNFDVPQAIDHQLLSGHMAELKGGGAIRKPRYSFATHQRSSESDILNPARIIVLEGIFAYWDERVRAECDLKIFLDAASDLRFIRRLQRDVRERGRTVDSIIAQYVETVRPMHEKYSTVMQGHADLVITNDALLENSVTKLLHAVHGLLERQRSAAAGQ